MDVPVSHVSLGCSVTMFQLLKQEQYVEHAQMATKEMERSVQV